MKLDLDPQSPVPLYHQIFERLRYAIATGRLTPGDTLPPVRESAAAWGVNLHTVRRGYAELARLGLVETRPPHPTRVIGIVEGEVARLSSRAAFVDRVVRDARELHGFGPAELAAAITDRNRPRPSRRSVHVVECSEFQSRGHAREIERHWEVEAAAWSLERDGEPPEGAVVATYFHYNDIRERWPHRFREIRFAAIQPSPDLLTVLDRARGKRKRITLELCEFEAGMASSIAADLSQLLPAARFDIRTRVVRQAGDRLTGSGRSMVLLSPRMWSALSETERAHPRAVELGYVFVAGELDGIGDHFGWSRRHQPDRDGVTVA